MSRSQFTQFPFGVITLIRLLVQCYLIIVCKPEYRGVLFACIYLSLGGKYSWISALERNLNTVEPSQKCKSESFLKNSDVFGCIFPVYCEKGESILKGVEKLFSFSVATVMVVYRLGSTVYGLFKWALRGVKTLDSWNRGVLKTTLETIKDQNVVESDLSTGWTANLWTVAFIALNNWWMNQIDFFQLLNANSIQIEVL